MTYELPLPAKHKAALWKVKIRDRERVEPPHVTVLHKTRAWRIGLRDGGFLDDHPPPGDVPGELVAHVLAHLPDLVAEWDRMYPESPVEGEPCRPTSTFCPTAAALPFGTPSRSVPEPM